MDEIIQMLEEIHLPFAYDHFAEGEAADGRVYFKASKVNIELYTDYKDLSAEQKVEAVLDGHGIFYEKSEVWIESEKLYEVLYQFEMEV